MLSLSLCLVHFSLHLVSGRPQSQCQLANWNDEQSKLTPYNDLIDLVNSAFGRDFLLKLDPIQLTNQEIVSESKRILGNDYDLTVTLDKIHVAGVQHLTLQPIAITSNTSVALKVKVGEKLNIAIAVNVSLTQKSRTDCGENEEGFLNYCYRKCSLFPGMPKDAIRISPQICAKKWYNWHWDGKPFGCSGFGVSNVNNTDGGFACPIKKGEKKVPRRLNIVVKLGLEEPSVLVDLLMKIKVCSGEVEQEATKKACTDLSTGDFMVALIKQQFGKFQKKALKRVDDIAVKRLDIDFKKITVADIDLPDRNYILNKVVDWITAVFRNRMNNKKFIYEKVTSLIENVARTEINSFLDDKLKPHYGSTCYDRRRLRH